MATPGKSNGHGAPRPPGSAVAAGVVSLLGDRASVGSEGGETPTVNTVARRARRVSIGAASFLSSLGRESPELSPSHRGGYYSPDDDRSSAASAFTANSHKTTPLPTASNRRKLRRRSFVSEPDVSLLQVATEAAAAGHLDSPHGGGTPVHRPSPRTRRGGDGVGSGAGSGIGTGSGTPRSGGRQQGKRGLSRTATAPAMHRNGGGGGGDTPKSGGGRTPGASSLSRVARSGRRVGKLRSAMSQMAMSTPPPRSVHSPHGSVSSRRSGGGGGGSLRRIKSSRLAVVTSEPEEHHVKVGVRIRPLISVERSKDPRICWDVRSTCSLAGRRACGCVPCEAVLTTRVLVAGGWRRG